MHHKNQDALQLLRWDQICGCYKREKMQACKKNQLPCDCWEKEWATKRKCEQPGEK